MRPSVVILTYNSESSIVETLESVAPLSDNIFVVDSFSNDRTSQIALTHGATVVEHTFENYGAQRNWAISKLPIKYDWQLHLDADERLTPDLRHEIMSLDERTDITGFYVPRILYFLGRPIRHGGMFPTWHMRLFRSGFGECEARQYDQHFRVTRGKTAQLRAYMVDDIRMSLNEWTVRHNRWSDAELQEQCDGTNEGRIAGRFSGNPVERKRFWRDLFNRSPLFLRPFALFVYRYVVRLGFLDGTTGLIFYVLQTFWFRFLVDSKLYERKLIRKLATTPKYSSEPVTSKNLHANPHTND
jgi:glycosyltransferase involved in cell wall biosynthesis